MMAGGRGRGKNGELGVGWGRAERGKGGREKVMNLNKKALLLDIKSFFSKHIIIFIFKFILFKWYLYK